MSSIEYVDNDDLEKEDISFTKNTINTILYTYFNNGNIENKYIDFKDETNRFILSKLYSLFNNFLKLNKGNIDVELLKELEDKIYNVNGNNLEDSLRINYEISKIISLDSITSRFKDDIRILINNMQNYVDNLNNELDLSELKKSIVILQILTSNNVTFFKEAYELLIDYCIALNSFFNREGFVGKDKKITKVINSD